MTRSNHYSNSSALKRESAMTLADFCSNHYSNSSALKLERSARAQVGRSNHYSNSSALKRHPCDIAAPALFQPLLKQQCSQTDLDR